MKECLQCQKQFKNKSPLAKFCSTNCRVKYHRNHPKPKKEEVITELKIQVLYNQMLEWMSKPNFIPPTSDAYNGTKTNIADEPPIWKDEPMFPSKPKIRRSYANYVQLKAACENEDDWEVLKSEILESGLPTSQIETLIS